MASSDFDIRNGMLLRYTGAGGDVVLPAEVRSIGADAFAGCEGLRSLRIDGRMDFIGTDAFARCPNAVVRAPLHPPGDAWDPESRLRMALGYCLEPELYEGDVAAAYARYAKGQRKRLEGAARKMGLALRCFPEEPEKPVNYRKLSEKQKVIALEEAVLSGEMDRVEKVLTECAAFELTARALGLACRFGSPAMVRRLVEAGCDFRLPQDASMTSKYDIYTHYTGYFNSRTLWHRFEYMLTADSVDDRERFGDFRGLTGILPEGGKKERAAIPEAERVEILRYLTAVKKVQTDLEGMFYEAVVAGRDGFIRVFLEQDILLTDFDVSRLEPRQRLDALPRMLDVARAQGKCQVPVTLGVLQSVQDDADLVARLLDEGKLPGKLDTTKLLKGSLEAANAGTLSLCLQRGFCKSIATRDKLIEQSIAENRPEHTAVLLEYKNRTADLRREAAMQEARDLKDLSAAPDSVYMMKKFWRFQRREDGTVLLTGYKGPGGAVWVPERIGKDAVTAVGERAFSPDALRLTAEQKEQRRAITSVTIPKTVTSLGPGLFENCTGLQEVRIEAAVTTLEKHTFRNCAALRRVTLPEGLKVIREAAFESCVSIEHITLPRSLQYLHNEVFGHCYALREIELPPEVKKIGKWLFQDCQALTRAVLPETLTELPAELFKACQRLREVTIPRKVQIIRSSAFEGCWALTELTVPPRVREIEFGAFQNCTALERIILPENLRVISSSVFSNCKKLTSIRLPRTMERIGACAFENCVSLETIEMPDTLQTLHTCAFKNCTALRSITLPKGLKELDNTLFQNCTALEEVTLLPFAQCIGAYTFQNCTALRRIDIPLTVASIGTSAFQGCTSLASIDLPEIIRQIGGRAFSDCAALKTVTIRANVTKFGDVTDLRGRMVLNTADVFDGCKNLTIRARAGSSAAAYAKEHRIPLELL